MDLLVAPPVDLLAHCLAVAVGFLLPQVTTGRDGVGTHVWLDMGSLLFEALPT